MHFPLQGAAARVLQPLDENGAVKTSDSSGAYGNAKRREPQDKEIVATMAFE